MSIIFEIVGLPRPLSDTMHENRNNYVNQQARFVSLLRKRLKHDTKDSRFDKFYSARNRIPSFPFHFFLFIFIVGSFLMQVNCATIVKIFVFILYNPTVISYEHRWETHIFFTFSYHQNSVLLLEIYLEVERIDRRRME